MGKRSSADRLFERVVADPTSEDAPALAAVVFAELERRTRPTAHQRSLLVDHAVLWWNLGFGPRARALLDRWSEATPEDPQLRRARARVALGSPSVLEVEHAGDGAASLVTRLVLTGNPDDAIDVARAHQWFSARPDPVVMFVGWAFALAGRFAEGERVVAKWRERASREPEWLHHVLKAEALLALHAGDFARELQAFRAAHALAVEHGFGIHRAAVEMPLACALAHGGELKAAMAIVDTWAAPGSSYVPIDAGRDLARAEVAFLAERWDEAEEAALRASAFFDTTDLVVYACMARALAAMSAPAERFSGSLDVYGRIVHRAHLPGQRARYQLLQRLAGRGMTSFRDLLVLERSRFGARPVSAVSIVVPRATTLAADIYWDQIQGQVWLRGRGPFCLEEHPVLARVLDVILRAPDQAVPLADLFAAVWTMPYNPLVHESKLHVTLHRVRGWLGQRIPGLASALVVRDGIASIATLASAIVLESPAATTLGDESTDPRVRLLECLTEAPLSPRELERRLGISRSTLHAIARDLLASREITRSGQGRALRYWRAR